MSYTAITNHRNLCIKAGIELETKHGETCWNDEHGCALKLLSSAVFQGYRTGYAYRFPVLLERSRTRREVEVPATATTFHQFDDDGIHPALRQHPFAQRQQQERTRWLNTPNTYQKVSQEQASPGHRTTVRLCNDFHWFITQIYRWCLRDV